LGDASYSVNETNSLAIVTVLRTGSTATAATVDFQTGDGTATAGRDYWVTAVSLRFAPGETVKEVAVPVLDDLEHEMTEFIILRLSNPGAGAVVGLPDTAAIAITDNDPPGPPIIRRQPADRTVATTYTATFQVVARGEPPLFYQWRKDEVPIPGATERTLTIQNARLADAGVYSVVVSNAYGVVVSSNATLVVNPLPVIVAQPQSQTIPYGEPVTFSVIATSSYPLVTQVLARAFTGSDRDWMQFSGGGATLQVQYDFKSDPDALEVYAVVGEEPVFLGSLATNGAGVFTVDCSSALGSPLAIQVTAGTEGGGDGWSYQVEQVTSPLTYRWRKDGGTLYEGSGTSYTIRTVTFADAGEYTVVVTDPAGSIVSEPAILTVAGPLLRVVPVTCPGTTNACIQLFWTVTDYHLEKQDDPTDLWHDVPNASSGIILPVCETQCLYRLRRTERPD